MLVATAWQLPRQPMVFVCSIMMDGVVLALMDLFGGLGILWDRILDAVVGAVVGYNHSTNFGHTAGDRIDCISFADYTSRYYNSDRSFELTRERRERTLLRCQQTPFFWRRRFSS
jgi:hypothetical protein